MKYWVKNKSDKIIKNIHYFNLPFFTAFQSIDKKSLNLFAEDKFFIFDLDFTNENILNVEDAFVELISKYSIYDKAIFNFPYSEQNLVCANILKKYRNNHVKFSFTISYKYESIIQANKVFELGFDYLVLKLEKTDYTNIFSCIQNLKEKTDYKTELVIDVPDNDEDIKTAHDWVPDIIFS